ncbi:MAG: M15 family metallopeptidase [Clostridia bacterium]|nr:M15 family metallopeptidase [Clostridia bacterium]
MRKYLCGILVVFSALVVFACSSTTVTDGSSVETTTTIATTVAPDPTATPVPTATPTPSPTPLPTPTPTPVPEYVEPQFDEVWYDNWVDGKTVPFVDPRSVRAEIISNPYAIDALVNKYYALPEDFKPDDLVSAPHSYDQMLREEANEAWIALYDGCVENTGEGLLLVSGWRDWGTQQFLFDRSKNKNGLAFACQKNAWLGRSEHQLGLAMDITNSWDDNISDDFGSTKAGMWVDEHCYEYGFIRRYQAQWVTETGYGIEAWHYRYVGVELATYLYENDMSLEAYLGKVQIMPGDEE